MEDSQKKVTCTGLPITDDRLIAIASSSLLSAGIFPKQRPDWDSLVTASKDWATRKTTFCTAQLTIKRKQCTTNT